jgi:hypothetical protein
MLYSRSMNPVLAPTLGVLVTASILLFGCDTRIEESPTEVVEQRAISSIRAAGGDPADWIVEGSCIGMGPCQTTGFAARFPDLELAQSNYLVRDSRAFPKDPDNIKIVAAKAAARDCFDRAPTAARLEACVSRQPGRTW